MTTSCTTRLSIIDFTHDIERFTEGFTGREWLLAQINNWLTQTEERFFVLTGEPGVGKSAIAAHLIQTRKDIVAYHFCRTGDAETARPGRILRSLAAQLGKTLPHYDLALINTIKPVHLEAEVKIQVESQTDSEITEVDIASLKSSDPENELDILIRAPLAVLPGIYAKRQETLPTPAIFVIDALGTAVAMTEGNDDDENIVTLLGALSQSEGLPSWVRFILTSRPDRRVLREFDSRMVHKLEETSEQSLADIWQYVERRVKQSSLRSQVDAAEISSKALVNELIQRSTGNFLYTKLVLDELEAGQYSLDNLSVLPKNLKEIYQGFFAQFTEDEWQKEYKPILKV
ncbi:ATP-binding protein, partial [Leptolyngbya sp. FACHB-671]|uniref:AAA family ATPase n=1 Tax=Leptolyngbya sp. FACHB-671 TaxID=2692812 RepID=UPI001682EA46